MRPEVNDARGVKNSSALAVMVIFTMHGGEVAHIQLWEVEEHLLDAILVPPTLNTPPSSKVYHQQNAAHPKHPKNN